ncbi:hypothetical protein [Sulfurimonas sp.]|uniref:DUF4198 domain-containing protein n=1 Tax=Sulfurimonas sp. TaxID=2022749 RepID=UPI00260774BA|nr:hypothetical protein [Sulfurimonas sp.]
MIKKTTILITLAYSLMAHDMWIDNSSTLLYGHIDKKSSHGDEREIKKDEISKVSCLKEGRIFDVSNKIIQNGCDALFVSLKKVYYTKTPYGTLKESKDKVKMPIKSFQSIESIKRIYNDKGDKLFKNGLELTLLNKPSEIEEGDKARLLVCFNAKPQKGVTVAYGDRVIGVSDEEGHVNVRIRALGLQNIKASYTLKGDGVKCDKIIHSTTLNIEIKK